VAGWWRLLGIKTKKILLFFVPFIGFLETIITTGSCYQVAVISYYHHSLTGFKPAMMTMLLLLSTIHFQLPNPTVIGDLEPIVMTFL
jgi:hypothetical protein